MSCVRHMKIMSATSNCKFLLKLAWFRLKKANNRLTTISDVSGVAKLFYSVQFHFVRRRLFQKGGWQCWQYLHCPRTITCHLQPCQSMPLVVLINERTGIKFTNRVVQLSWVGHSISFRWKKSICVWLLKRWLPSIIRQNARRIDAKPQTVFRNDECARAHFII